MSSGDSEGVGGVEALFFLIIGLPLGLSFLGLPNFFVGFLAMIHEMGHFAVMLLDVFLLPGDQWLLVVFAGGLTECMLPLASFLLLYPKKKLFTVACLFLAATGAAFLDTGDYMSSAQNPYGYSFISKQPMTYDTHDWTIIFSQLGVLDKADEISNMFRDLGRVLEYLGFYTALAALFMYEPTQPRVKAGIYGAILALTYALIRQLSQAAFILILILALMYVYAQSREVTVFRREM